MLYHVIHRPPNLNSTNSSNQSRNHRRSGSVSSSTLMPRYHYSRIAPNSATNNSDSLLPKNYFDNQTSKLPMTATTTTTSNNNNNQNSYGSFKSTIIPLVTNNRTPTSNKREFIQIPITREDGISNQTRSVPVTFITETSALSPTPNNNNNENLSPKPTFTNLLRPNSKYFQYHFNNSLEEPTLTTTASSVPRLPSVSRRLSLTIPITTTVSTSTDDDTIKQTIPSSSTRQIPIRLPQTPTASSANASIPINASRISSAVLRSSPVSNALQRQKTDIGDSASSSPALLTINNFHQSLSDFPISTPIRRAEVMAREAIQGIARFQQQRNGSISENSNNRSSSPLSRRVIINLKNNQSTSLDNRHSSAMKPPAIPSSSRLPQRNNFYHIPVLHEIQMPSHPATILAESSFQSPSISNNYKNEFHMKIPVSIATTNNDQENDSEQNDELINHERIPSANNNNSNQTLKSILKRSSSRETVSRKNVSFMNA